MTTIVGIDVGQRTCHIGILNGSPEPLEMTAKRSATAQTVLDHIGRDGGALITMELTGSLARPIIEGLEGHGHQILIAQHTDTLALRTLTRRRQKTDELDALLIAEMTRLLTHPDTAPLIGAYLTPWEEMQSAILGRTRVRHLQRITRKRARARQQLKALNDDIEKDHLEQEVELYSAQIKEVERQILGLATTRDRLLETIPGVSLRRACILNGTIGDVHRYPTADQLVSYLGLRPPRRPQSGAKLGRRQVPRAVDMLHTELHMYGLWVAGNSAKAGAMGATYQRLSARHNGRIALWAVKRQLIRTCWGMLRNNQPFRMEKTPCSQQT